jgi:hypothetical protein
VQRFTRVYLVEIDTLPECSIPGWLDYSRWRYARVQSVCAWRQVAGAMRLHSDYISSGPRIALFPLQGSNTSVCFPVEQERNSPRIVSER